MAKITYLLGAGASIESVPIVSEIELRLIIYKNYLVKYFSKKGIDDYINELSDIIQNMSGNTIDEYAMTLHRNRAEQNKFNKLKAIIIGFLLFEQMSKKNSDFETDKINNEDAPPYKIAPSEEINRKIKNTLDKRYLGFLGKILDVNNRLNSEVNILSWNYDMQLEIAMERIGIAYKYLDRHMDIFPYPGIIDFNEYIASDRIHDILKLNGTGGVFKRKEQIISVYESQQENFDDIIEIIINIYKEAQTRLEHYNPLFNFAWEQNKHSEYVLSRAKKMIKETEVLVIIGYSFPDFNRDIDRKIFSNSTNIKKVYLQVNNNASVPLNMRALNNNFNSFLEIVPYVNSFCIPPEF